MSGTLITIGFLGLVTGNSWAWLTLSSGTTEYLKINEILSITDWIFIVGFFWYLLTKFRVWWHHS